MLSILNPEPPMDPVVERKITYVSVIGITFVLGFLLLVWLSFMGLLPMRIFWPASLAETLSGSFMYRKINSLRNSKSMSPH